MRSRAALDEMSLFCAAAVRWNPFNWTMHKNPDAGKKTGARKSIRTARAAVPADATRPVAAERARFHNIPRSVNELLSRRSNLARLADRAADPDDWSGWLAAQLDAELAAHLIEVVAHAEAGPGPPGARRARLVLYADSPAWCVRLRYALGALAAPLASRGVPPHGWQVRVRRTGRS